MRSYIRHTTCLALAFAACDGGPDALDVEVAPLAAAYSARVAQDTLIITGTSADSRLTLRLTDAATLGVDVGADGTYEHTFDRSTFSAIVVDAAGGADVVRIDESAGAFSHEEIITLRGGPGNDTLQGGVGPETLDGGTGADTIDGSYGVDRILLGAGNDTASWSPGGGSDVIEGGDGFDRLVVSGAAIGESIGIAAAGERVRFTRDVAAIVLDAGALEAITFRAMGGVDRIDVGELAGTTLERVDVDLAGSGGAAPDGVADVVTVRGKPGDGGVDVVAEGAAVVALGLAVDVGVSNGDPGLDRLVVADVADVAVRGTGGADTIDVTSIGGAPLVFVNGWSVGATATGTSTLAVEGLGGADVIRAVGGATTPALRLDGGPGDDTITGAAGVDTIVGGSGRDVLDGGYGADSIAAGDGADTVAWAPGGGNDVIDGGGGADVLNVSGSAAGEAIELVADGSHLRLTRDIATITLDVAGVEQVAYRALAGTDRVRVHDLGATSVDRVSIDLGTYDGLGDAAADVVSLVGPTLGGVVVVADGDALVATGLGTEVRVVRGEAALDTVVGDGVGDLDVRGGAGPDVIDVFAVAGAPRVLLAATNGAVTAAGATDMVIDGRGGDDTIVTASAVTAPVQLAGGAGNDRLVGGTGTDVLDGGAGADVLDGGYGVDRILMGSGDDTYTWDPGKSSDVIDGEGGVDVVRFTGANIGEVLDVSASGARVRITRDIAQVTLDVGGVERLELRTLGGADSVVVHDLAGTPVDDVHVDFAPYGGVGGDGQVDVVSVLGSSRADTIDVRAEGDTIVTSGLTATVHLRNHEWWDQLQVNGLAGVDTLRAGPGVESALTLVLLQD